MPTSKAGPAKAVVSLVVGQFVTGATALSLEVYDDGAYQVGAPLSADCHASCARVAEIFARHLRAAGKEAVEAGFVSPGEALRE